MNTNNDCGEKETDVTNETVIALGFPYLLMPEITQTG